MPAQLRATVKDETFNLQQNIPNPFADMTTIYFNLPAESNVDITLYDMTGREVKTILNSSKSKGLHSIDFINSDLPSGIYYYKLTAGDRSLTKKLMIIN
jgi:hypothetical protein